MKILITSDMHGHIEKIAHIKKQYTLHIDAGDSMLYEAFLQSKGIHSVKGNCDASLLPMERIFEVDGMKIGITHGHQFGVKSGLGKLIEYAKIKHLDICIYGHTHIQNIETIDGITFVNPGAILNKGLEYALYEKGEIQLKKEYV